MKVDVELSNLSYFVIAGDTEHVNVIDTAGYEEYSWVLYILAESYGTGFSKKSKTFDSTIITYFNSNTKTPFDYFSSNFSSMHTHDFKHCVYTKPALPDMLSYIVTQSLEKSTEGDFLILTKNDSAVLSPYLSVGTKIPLSVDVDTIAKLISVCGTPCNTHGVLVGDVDLATSLLGEGLQRVRSVLFDYLEVQTGPTSVPSDINIPLIYSTYSQTPSMLDILQAQSSGGPESRKSFMLTSVLTASCFMYSLLEMDHGYRGIDIFEESHNLYPEEWCVESKTSRTKVPFRYPALVHILNGLTKYTSIKANKPEVLLDSHDLEKLVTYWGSDNPLSEIVTLQAADEYSMLLFDKLPALCKGFFLQLYRLTCKDVISMPNKKKFPLRSDASRLFANAYKGYTQSNNLSSYMALAEMVIQTSLLQQRDRLKVLCRVTGLAPYDIVSNPNTIPPVNVSGSFSKETMPNLWRWQDYENRINLWSDIKVKTEWGTLVNIKDMLENFTLELLDDLLKIANTDKLYTLVSSNSLNKMVGQYGFSEVNLSIDRLEDRVIPRVKFNIEPISRLNLLEIVKYHRGLGHPATEKVITTVCKLLEANIMDTFSTNPKDTTGPDYCERSTKLAVIQYLREVLDTSRV